MVIKNNLTWQRYIKRILDLIFAFSALCFLLPVFGIIMLLVRMKLGKPTLYFQIRPGQNAKPFRLVKFRTMDESRDESGNLLDDERRLTKLGTILRNTSFDELPELFNVVKGDMSIVGPRPLLMEYLDRYTISQARRHEVKPGITGWAQINGRNAITWEKKFSYDIWYVDNWSLWLDTKIIFITLIKALKAEGINQPGGVTMEKFRGSDGKRD